MNIVSRRTFGRGKYKNHFNCLIFLAKYFKEKVEIVRKTYLFRKIDHSFTKKKTPFTILRLYLFAANPSNLADLRHRRSLNTKLIVSRTHRSTLAMGGQ